MSRFRVGDVCVIINAERFPESIGTEVTVVRVGVLCRGHGGVRDDGVEVTPAPGFGIYKPEHLRLRRPPSWDRWIYDTRDVQVDSPIKGEVGA